MLLYRRFCPHFSFFGLILVILTVISCIVQLSCTSYGVGGLYTSNQPTEAGVYLYADAKFAEASASYSLNLSDYDIQSLGAGISLKVPISFWEISVYPLANIEYQHVLSEAVSINNLAWFRFGAGVDFPIESPFYVRVQGMYTPDLFSSLPLPFEDSISNIIGLNNSKGYTVKLALGWRPGVSGRTTVPQAPRTTAQPAQPRPQQQAAQQTAQQQPQQSQAQAREHAAQSSITLPNRRLTEAERNAWIAEYRSNGGSSLFEQEVVRLVNLIRAEHRLSQVSIDNTLMMAARFYAQNLRQIGTLGHNIGPYATDPNATHGASANTAAAFGARLRWNGGNGSMHSGAHTPQSLVTSWMNSDGHRRYILSPEHRFIGVGSVGANPQFNYMFLSDQSSR